MREKEPVAKLESFELIADDGSVCLPDKSTKKKIKNKKLKILKK